jgi:hypothetical protein
VDRPNIFCPQFYRRNEASRKLETDTRKHMEWYFPHTWILFLTFDDDIDVQTSKWPGRNRICIVKLHRISFMISHLICYRTKDMEIHAMSISILNYLHVPIFQTMCQYLFLKLVNIIFFGYYSKAHLHSLFTSHELLKLVNTIFFRLLKLVNIIFFGYYCISCWSTTSEGQFGNYQKKPPPRKSRVQLHLPQRPSRNPSWFPPCRLPGPPGSHVISKFSSQEEVTAQVTRPSSRARAHHLNFSNFTNTPSLHSKPHTWQRSRTESCTEATCEKYPGTLGGRL